MRQHRESVERGGRDRLFFIGEGEGFKYFDSEDNQHDFTDDFRSLPWIENENGCFFLPVLPGADTNITATTKKEPNPTGNRFKMSWIDVASCANAENAVVTDPNFRARCWATFDLGLIGIHEPLYRAESAAKLDERTTYERKIGAGGTTFMTLNKSIRYMNYCQAHWDLPKSDRKHWLIVDTHAADPAVDPTHDYRIVTIAPFDPHPLGDNFRAVGFSPRLCRRRSPTDAAQHHHRDSDGGCRLPLVGGQLDRGGPRRRQRNAR